MTLKISVFISLILFSFCCNGQQIKTHDVYFQKIHAFSNGKTALATRIYDSLNVYGYVSGYDPAQFYKLSWAGKFSGTDNFEQAVFLEIEKADTVQFAFKNALLPDSQKTYSEATIDYGSILFGSIASGGFWIYDLYYSEILNRAEVEFTANTVVICVYPLKKKNTLQYRIVVIEQNDNRQYAISYKLLNYTNPLEPKTEKSGITVITKEKFINELKKQISITSMVDDTQNQCAAADLPRLVALSEKRFFYSTKCYLEHTKLISEHPMRLSTYLERMFYKYLYKD